MAALADRPVSPDQGEPRKSNFLFVSYDGLIGDIAWQVLKEGHPVRYCVQNPDDQEVGAGFVPMVADWRAEVDWADVIVFPIASSMVSRTRSSTSNRIPPGTYSNPRAKRRT